MDAYRLRHAEPGRYTWWDYRAGIFHKNFGMRIDHLLVTRPVAERTVWAEIDREARKGKPIPSDHAPLVIDLDEPGPPVRRRLGGGRGAHRGPLGRSALVSSPLATSRRLVAGGGGGALAGRVRAHPHHSASGGRLGHAWRTRWRPESAPPPPPAKAKAPPAGGTRLARLSNPCIFKPPLTKEPNMPELLSRLQGALADRYRIEREIGAGGMATVYLAQDLRHDRKVALKLLRPELSAVIGAERFLAEIKLTANLQHPHILPLFDSGEADGFLFYVMPFVEGESLRDRLNREKQLPVADAVRIATEVASALDYAHRHGVVHRDIKPENILLHDGRALVADFGIALAASKAGGSRMTETGMSLGTPHYMSPEQAMGEREITARSDVYALGACSTRCSPATRRSPARPRRRSWPGCSPSRRARSCPQRHTIPPHVEAAVLTALEKLPADRFGTAAEFAEALGGPELRADRRPRRRPRRLAATAVAAQAPAIRSRSALVGVAVARHRRRALGLAPARARAARSTGSASSCRRSRRSQPVTQSGNRVAISPDGKRHRLRRARRSGAASSGSGSTTSSTPRRSPGPRARARRSSRPTAASVGFLISGTTLRTVSLDGGPMLTLTDSANSTGGDWGPDGYIYFEVDSGIARIRASGGPIEPLYNLLHAEGGRRGVAGGAARRQGDPLPDPARRTSRPATSRSWR